MRMRSPRNQGGRPSAVQRTFRSWRARALAVAWGISSRSATALERLSEWRGQAGARPTVLTACSLSGRRRARLRAAARASRITLVGTVKSGASSTSYRGSMAVHAAARVHPQVDGLASRWAMRSRGRLRRRSHRRSRRDPEVQRKLQRPARITSSPLGRKHRDPAAPSRRAVDRWLARPGWRCCGHRVLVAGAFLMAADHGDAGDDGRDYLGFACSISDRALACDGADGSVVVARRRCRSATSVSG